MEKIVYYSSGMQHFGKRMVEDMEFRKYNPQTDRNKEVFFQGLYFQEDYIAFQQHLGKRVLYWNGNDVIRALTTPHWLTIILNTPARHLCHSYWQKEVWRRLGIEVEIYPIFFGNINNFPITYKRSDTPHVYITSHDGRGKEYGVDVIERVAPLVPEITFHIYGEKNSSPNTNVIYHGWVEESEMDADIKGYHGCIKGGSDGIAITLMKCILLGQYPISYQKIEGVWHAPDDKTLVKMLKKLKKQEEPNYKLREQYINHFKPYGE